MVGRIGGWRLVVLVPWGVGCAGEKAADCADGEVEVDGVCVAEGCAAVAEAAARPDPGEGTLSAALATAVAGDTVALTAGTYVEDGPIGVPGGVRVVGICADAVRVEAPVIGAGFELEDADGAALAGFTLVGGAPGLAITAASPAAVTVDGVTVRSAGTHGVYVAGAVTLDATDLLVEDTLLAGDGTFGRGLGAQGGASVRLTRATFRANAEVGLFADGSTLDLTDVVVADTQPTAAGFYGRGVHVQRAATLVGVGLVVSGSRDAGVSILDSDAELDGGSVTGTASAPLADGTGEAGDGVAVFLGSEAGTPGGTVRLAEMVVSDNARAGVVVDGVPATLDRLTLDGNLYSWVSQNDGALTGTETCSIGEGQTSLADVSGVDALPIYDEPME